MTFILCYSGWCVVCPSFQRLRRESFIDRIILNGSHQLQLWTAANRYGAFGRNPRPPQGNYGAEQKATFLSWHKTNFGPSAHSNREISDSVLATFAYSC